MLKLIAKKVVYLGLVIYLYSIGNILYYLSRKYASIHTKLIHQVEWRFSKIKPSHYKHEINLYNWMFDTSNVEFIEWGALPRMFIAQNDNVLDLCCGDGSNAYLFFSDIAGKIDAVDYDAKALEYASRHYKKSNINYIYEDLLHFIPSKKYEIIVWSAGIAYFPPNERKIVFNNIFNALRDEGKVIIMTPLEPTNSRAGDGQVEKVYHITNITDFENEFNDMFDIYFFNKTQYNIRTNLQYILQKKL